MARSTYIYVATWADRVGSSAPVLAATVKREFLDALERFGTPDAQADLEIWRCPDGGASPHGPQKHYLGTGGEYLAKERPADG